MAIDSTPAGKNVSTKMNASKDLEFAETELVPMSTEDSTAHAQMDMLQVKSIFSQKPEQLCALNLHSVLLHRRDAQV